jgi:two-component system, chemotaxis family, chemotaxis protein CheY
MQPTTPDYSQRKAPQRSAAAQSSDFFDREGDQDPPPSPLGHISILLVDDDPDIRTLTRTFLEHTGFRVLTCANADRAARIFRRAPHIDLLITDQNMPGRSGTDLAFQLKTVRPELPVLMISGALESVSRPALPRTGWNFLPKPFSLPALLDTVHRILRTGEGHAEPPPVSAQTHSTAV